MEEKFDWIENGVLKYNRVNGNWTPSNMPMPNMPMNMPNMPMQQQQQQHSTTIYNEGGYELTAIARFQLDDPSAGTPMGPMGPMHGHGPWSRGPGLSLSLIAKPCQPPMLNMRMKVTRQGLLPHNKRNILEQELNLNDENYWRSGSGSTWITLKERITLVSEDNEGLYYKLFINFTFVKPYLAKPSMIPLVDGPTFQDLLKDRKIMDETSDFKIVCQGEELKCHKLVLSLRSDFFKKMFNQEYKESNEGFMTTTDFNAQTMKSFLKYLYTDSIDQVEIDYDLLRAAHLYDFKKLISECVRGLSMKINDDNVKDMLQIALMLELPTLLEQVKEQVGKQLENWRENQNQKHKTQIYQFLGSMKIGQDLDMEGFDEALKTHLNQYLDTQKKIKLEL